MSEAVKYIEQKYGKRVTRQTIYNWAKQKDSKLQIGKEGAHGTYTTTTWVDNYLSCMGVPPISVRPADGLSKPPRV